VVFGATDPKTGAAGSRFDLLDNAAHNHRPQLSSGCLAVECGAQLQAFFQRRRTRAEMVDP
jgi:tRNA(adenine34) deaminase